MTDDAYPYVWRWRRWRPPGYGVAVEHVFADRFGQRCRVLARGRSMGSVAVEFASDGLRAVVSARALRRADRYGTAGSRINARRGRGVPVRIGVAEITMRRGAASLAVGASQPVDGPARPGSLQMGGPRGCTTTWRGQPEGGT